MKKNKNKTKPKSHLVAYWSDCKMRGVRNSLTIGRLAVNTSKGVKFGNGECYIFDNFFFFSFYSELVLLRVTLFAVSTRLQCKYCEMILIGEEAKIKAWYMQNRGDLKYTSRSCSWNIFLFLYRFIFISFYYN